MRRDHQAVTVHGTRAITGHVTEEMTEHYSHVDRAEKLRAADQVVALAGLRAPANDNTVAEAAPAGPASGGSGGGLNGEGRRRRLALTLTLPRVRGRGPEIRRNRENPGVRSGRVELPQYCYHQNLNLARLPVPPRPLIVSLYWLLRGRHSSVGIWRRQAQSAGRGAGVTSTRAPCRRREARRPGCGCARP